MHSLMLAALLAASSAVAAPTAAAAAAYPTPTFTCAKGLKPFLAHFDDLPGVANNSRAIPVNKNGKPETGVYKNLHFGVNDWWIVSPGYMTVPFKEGSNDNEVEGDMTVHSGKNAIINGEPVPLPIAVMYGNDYYNLKSFWVRSHSASAFTLELRCFVLNNQGTTTPKEIDIQIPAVPLNVNGGYYKVQLNQAQQQKFSKISSCLIGDKKQQSFTLLDDMEYCYYHYPGAPY